MPVKKSKGTTPQPKFSPIYRRVPGGKVKFSVELDWERYASRTQELIKLNENYWITQLCELTAQPFMGTSTNDLLYLATDDQLLQKYGPWDTDAVSMAMGIREYYEDKQREVGPLTWVDLLDEFVGTVPRTEMSYNWAPYDAQSRRDIRESEGAEAFKECKDLELESHHEPALPAGVPAFVTIQVPVSPMKVWGIDKIVASIGEVLRDALRNCPSQDEAPLMRGTIPPQREFLFNAHEPVLRKDIERYKLYTQHGLTFRQIAAFEYAREKGRPIAIENIPKKIKIDVPKESAVCESVTRIYEAIYLKPFYQARRRRLDAPAKGFSEYTCPEHGRDCHEECQHLKEWLTKVNRTLPTDHTGAGKKLRGQ